MAFAVLSISLGLLLQSFSSSLRGVAVSERYTKAVMLAESLLAESGVTNPLRPGESAGQMEENLQWRLSVTQYAEEQQSDFEQSVLPYQVTATVSWEEGGNQRDVSLTTLKLAEVAE